MNTVGNLLADLKDYDPDCSAVDIIKHAVELIECLIAPASEEDGQRILRAMRNNPHLADIALNAWVQERCAFACTQMVAG